MTRHPDLLRALSDRGGRARESEESGTRGPLGAFMRVYERFAARYERLLDRALDHKFVVIGAVAVLFVVSMLIYPLIGTELFPQTDAGQFIINFRAPRRHPHRDHRGADRADRERDPPGDSGPASSRPSCLESRTGARASRRSTRPTPRSDSGFMMVALKHDHKVSTCEYMHRLKQASCRRRCPRCRPSSPPAASSIRC